MPALRFIWVIFLFCGAAYLPAEIEWIEDLEQAKAEAHDQDKHMVLYFKGGEWCGYCVALERDILDQEAFSDAVGDRYVWAVVDVPRSRMVDGEVHPGYIKADEYGIKGFPTLLIIEPGGEIVGQTGYFRDTPEEYASRIGGIVGEAKEHSAGSSCSK